MNLLDENIRRDQGDQLRGWGVRFRTLAKEVARSGIKDQDVIPLLHHLKSPTFFSHDRDYFRRNLVHPNYCLVWLDLFDGEAAKFIRAFLKHRQFDTQAKRNGVVARVHHEGVHFWQRNRPTLQSVNWPQN